MNDDINEMIKAAGLYKCQVARELGIFEHDLYRLLSRKPLTQERRQEIINAIEALTEGGKHE